MDSLKFDDYEKCTHFGICGGCKYMDKSYAEQLKIKEELVKGLLDEALKKQKSDWVFEGIKESPVMEGYRNKMEFSFGDSQKDGPLELGMHQKGSFYSVVTVSDCKIVDDAYRTILVNTRDFFKEYTFYHKKKHTGYLRHLLIRKAVKTGEILVALVTASAVGGINGTPSSGEEKELLENYKELICNLQLADGNVVGILHIVNDSLSDTVQADRVDILYGRDYINEEVLGLKFKISTFSFFQTNSLGAEVLYDTVREYIGELGNQSVVYDLYSGTGTIAQLMAPVSKKVIGVEIIEEAVEAARENAKINGLDNCEFIAGDVLKVLDTIEERPDFIILDPPRDGIHPKALKKIIDYDVERLIYVSCKPTSLARDLESFVLAGYHVEKAVCVDMFPHTQHVETVVLLSKGVVDKDSFRKVKVDFSLEDMDLTELRGKATYAQVKEYILNEFGLKVSSLYIAQVKKKCGIETGENHNLPKSEGAKGPVDLCSARTEVETKTARQPQVTPEKEEAIMKAFRHFGVTEDNVD